MLVPCGISEYRKKLIVNYFQDLSSVGCSEICLTEAVFVAVNGALAELTVRKYE